MIDYHVHTSLCKHASGKMEDYVISAVEKGIEEMAFTDHIPISLPIIKEDCMDPHELDGYVTRVLDLKEQYKEDISIKLGLEADFIEGEEETILTILEKYPFDVVLGSVHMVDGWAVDHPKFKYKYEEGNVLAIYNRYIECLIKAVKSGMYDIMAHLDLVKKMNYFPENADITYLFKEVLDVISEEGLCIELSSAGLRKPVGEQYPGPGLLKYAVEHGVGVATGSDAHAPGEVGMDFDRMYNMLSELGVKSLPSFTGRKRSDKTIMQRNT